MSRMRARRTKLDSLREHRRSDADKVAESRPQTPPPKTETAAQAAAAKAAELARMPTRPRKNRSAADNRGRHLPGVKPPWQREALAPDTGGGIPPAPRLHRSQNPVDTEEKAADHRDRRTQVDDAAANGTDKDRFVRSPTRSIGRSQIKAKDLPTSTKSRDARRRRIGGPYLGGLGPLAPTGRPGWHRERCAPACQIRRIDPWSTLKISAVLAVIGFFIWMIAVAMLYLLLDGMGVWSQVNSSVSADHRRQRIVRTPSGRARCSVGPSCWV